MAISMRHPSVSLWNRSSAGGRIALSGGLPHASLLAPMTLPRASTSWMRLTPVEVGIRLGMLPLRTAALHWLATRSASLKASSWILYRMARSELALTAIRTTSRSAVAVVV